MMIEFALDLTWVRHKIVGGTESFVNNLLLGFKKTNRSFRLVMICAKDNFFLFERYLDDPRICMIVAPIESASVYKRIIWQNLHMSSFLKKNSLEICLEPVYSKPILSQKDIKFLTVIHDLEAIHFPENHSFFSNYWLRVNWKSSVKTSIHIVAISDYVKKDIIHQYGIPEKAITTIYDPIDISTSERVDFSIIQEKYNLSKNNYYYTVSKLNRHKNLTTLVKVFGELKKRGIDDVPLKLVVSGVNGGMADEMIKIARQYDIVDNILLTGFVENEIRNTLYANARAFLFPSVFEGFGMPLIEAICSGIPVITTSEACIPEITQGLANYVIDPYSVDEWIDRMQHPTNNSDCFDTTIFKPEIIANKYLDVMESFIV